MSREMLPDWLVERQNREEREKKGPEPQPLHIEEPLPPSEPPDEGEEKRPSWHENQDEGERGYHEEQIF